MRLINLRLPLGPVGSCSDRFGSIRFPVGSDWFESVRLDSVWFGSVRIGSVPLSVVFCQRGCASTRLNRQFPEITGEDNLTVFSYSGRVKSPEWRWQRRRADLRQF